MFVRFDVLLNPCYSRLRLVVNNQGNIRIVCNLMGLINIFDGIISHDGAPFTAVLIYAHSAINIIYSDMSDILGLTQDSHIPLKISLIEIDFCS